MKCCVWSGGSWVWLVVMTTTLHRTQAQCENGDIRLQEVLNTTQFISGRVEVCVGGDWRAVCRYEWDETDARVACREILGYPTQAFSVTSSRSSGFTFGQGSAGGITGVKCTGNEATLLECAHMDMATCSEDAGMSCCKVCPPPKLANGSGDSTDLCTALGGGLGILSAVLAILLVGVVLGWVWSCHRRRGKSGIHERSSDPTVNPNPSYTNPLRPRDTPTSGMGQQGAGEYEDMEGDYVNMEVGGAHYEEIEGGGAGLQSAHL